MVVRMGRETRGYCQAFRTFLPTLVPLVYLFPRIREVRDHLMLFISLFLRVEMTRVITCLRVSIIP